LLKAQPADALQSQELPRVLRDLRSGADTRERICDKDNLIGARWKARKRFDACVGGAALDQDPIASNHPGKTCETHWIVSGLRVERNVRILGNPSFELFFGTVESPYHQPWRLSVFRVDDIESLVECSMSFNDERKSGFARERNLTPERLDFGSASSLRYPAAPNSPDVLVRDNLTHEQFDVVIEFGCVFGADAD